MKGFRFDVLLGLLVVTLRSYWVIVSVGFLIVVTIILLCFGCNSPDPSVIQPQDITVDVGSDGINIRWPGFNLKQEK